MRMELFLLASSLLAGTCAAAEDPDLAFGLLVSGPGAGEIIRQDITQEVIGRIPPWLDGILIQNGGGRFEWPGSGRTLTNPGDGFGKVEVFTFKNGSLEYTSKFTRSQWWNNSVKADDIAPSLAFSKPVPPRRSDKEGLPNCLAPNDNLAVNVITIGGQILLNSDLPGCIPFDPKTLDFGKAGFPVMGGFKDDPPIPLGMQGAFGAAHPLWTESSLDGSGDVYGLLNVQRLATVDPRQEELRLFRITAEEQKMPGNPWRTRKAIATIKSPKGQYAPYMHSFVLAGMQTGPPTHAVLVSHSMHVAMAKVIKGVGLLPITAAFDIDPSRVMTFHVVSLSDGGTEQTIDVPMSSFGFKFNSTLVSHTVNGYFDGNGHLVIDVIGYSFLFFERFNLDIFLNKTERDHGKYAGQGAQTFRFTMNLEERRAVSVIELLPNSDWEFPTINEAFKGKPYCYAYGYDFSHLPEDPHGATGFASMAVMKYNVCGPIVGASNGEPKMREHISFARPFVYFMEPWFVPRPGGIDEDDGVVLALALDGKKSKGVLYVLNASDLSVIAIAPLPQLVNLKTHGRFIWSRALEQQPTLVDWETVVV